MKNTLQREEIQKRLKDGSAKELLLDLGDAKWCSWSSKPDVQAKCASQNLHLSWEVLRMQIPVDCLGMCMCLIFLKVLDHVLKLKHVLLHDWATMRACVVGCAALKSVGVTKMLKCNCSDTRLN